MTILLKREFLINGESGKVVMFLVAASVSNLELLSVSEKSIWEEEKKYRRQSLDWLSGRISAKLAVRKFLAESISMNNINIYNDEKGRPLLEGIANRDSIILSISHCDGRGLGCATMNYNGIGCDIERIKKRETVFWSYISYDKEISLWCREFPNITVNILSTIVWSAKEAVIKCLSTKDNIPDSMKDIIITPENRCNKYTFSVNDMVGHGNWLLYGKYILSFCVIDED